jgi:hypothetical protein
MPESFKDALEDAALEGILMRLRRFSEFLGKSSGQHATDLRAGDWVQWQPEVWLDPRIRARIDWQVAHLSSFREWKVEWKLCEHVLGCCEDLLRFFDKVDLENGDRLAAFTDAPELARDHVAELKKLGL